MIAKFQGKAEIRICPSVILAVQEGGEGGANAPKQ